MAGAVEIEKNVETRRVTESIPVRREEAVIERQAAAPGSFSDASIGDEEIRVPLREEELTIQKRTVPREELVVRKREVVEDREISADLRREEAEIQTEGDVRLREENH
jgi:uncharacterized protein (TIGR02271 family)